MSDDSVVEINRAVSLSLLKSCGYLAMRTQKMLKAPSEVYGWDPKTNNAEATALVLRRVEHEDDNFGIHLCGRVVDVDVDTDDPLVFAALDYFLPKSSHIWGRASKPRSHRLYEVSEDGFDPDDYPFLETLKAAKGYSIELRGGLISSGKYTILPGSIHPSGEMYEWNNLSEARGSTPVVASAGRITRALRFATVAAIFAKYWVEGNRNTLVQPVCGVLYRAVQTTTELGESAPFVFGQDEAREILECVLDISDDDEPAMRLRTFDATWDKGDSDTPISGGTKLRQFWEDQGEEDASGLLRLINTMLVGTSAMDEYEDFRSRYAFIMNCDVVHDMRAKGYAREEMTTADFLRWNEDKVIQIPGTKKIIPMANILKKSPRRIKVVARRFCPDKPTLFEGSDTDGVEGESNLFLNTWTGFAIPPWEGEVTDDDVKPILEYFFDVLANGEVAIYHWLLSWCADIFQHPETKPGTALVLVGKPGAGKTFLGEHLLRPIIGPRHSALAPNMERALGHFNADMAGKVFIQCDEALNSRRRADANKLKALITDRTIRVELKGRDPYVLDDCSRWCFTSNNIHEAVAVVDGRADRRYQINEVSDRYTPRKYPEESKRFWTEMHKWVGKRDNLAKLHRWFLGYGNEEASFRQLVETEAQLLTQQSSAIGFDDWLMSIVNYNNPFENVPARREDRPHAFSFVLQGEPDSGLSKYEDCETDWPTTVTMVGAEKSYLHFLKQNRSHSGAASLNSQQILREFYTRGLMDPRDKEKRVARTCMVADEMGDLVQRKVKLRLRAWPSRETILGYLKEEYGFEVGETEEVEDEPEPEPGREF